ncbi:MAG: AMP-binding protein [Propionibacterium sp.]|nr:AMP-binding protein [Propionibacterium sp.]
MRTFAQVVRGRVGDTHEGLRFEGRSWTWDEVVREACVRASLLRTFTPIHDRSADGYGPRTHVGILMQNVPDFVFWLLGAALNGDVVVGINPTRRGAELELDIAHAECDLIITENHYLDELAAISLGIPTEHLLNVDTEHYAELLRAHRDADLPEVDPAADDLLLLLFSSGSTGAPKAVICSQGRLGGLTDSMSERIGIHRDSMVYMSLPLFHGHAIMMCLATAANVGATVVMVRKFSASRFAADLHEHRITFFNYVGRMLSYVLNQPAAPIERDNALEVVFGSEASPAEVRLFRERFGCEDVREGYGASEGVLRITPVPGSPDNALGLPAAGVEVEVRDPDTGLECPRAIFDADGVLLNAGEATGELVALGRGPSFEGYYKNPDAMADRLRFDGADFWTGDLGYRDADGYFYFAGRSTDWLRVDGENFGAAAIERILVRFPAFSGAHVLAVADPNTGDQVMAVVTLKPGAVFDAEAFADFLAEQPDLGSKWRPTFVRIVDEVPITGSGKINKAPLRQVAWEAPEVWYAPTRTSPYRPLTDQQRTEFRDAFRANGRANHLPQPEAGAAR